MLTSAALTLDISITRITRYCNLIKKHFILSPKFKKEFTFIIDDYAMRSEKPNTEPIDITNIDLTNFPLHKVGLYDENKTDLIGLFDTVVEVNTYLGLDPKARTRRYLNKEHKIYSPTMNKSFYIVKNVNSTKSFPCRLTNIKTNEIIDFKSVTDLVVYLGLAKGYATKFKNIYILTGKLYKDIYKCELIQQ